MCGRLSLGVEAKRVEAEFGVELPADYRRHWQPRYNICPSHGLLAVTMDRNREGTVAAEIYQWGLVPHWSDDPNNVQRSINARVETLLEKPSFRDPARYRRCLIPASGYYEWQREGGALHPYHHALETGELMALAGIWEHWQGLDGSEILSIAILTLPARGAAAKIHDRMPLIVGRNDWQAWCDPLNVQPAALLARLRAIGPPPLRVHAVSPRVNRAGEEGADLAEAVAPPPEQLGLGF